MYSPPFFEEKRPEVLHALIAAHPLATLVTLNAQGLVADLVPLLFRPAATGTQATLGRLIGHVARANPLWRETRMEVPVLAVFQGPQSYISPSWYATKSENHQVVPTWNYTVVQATGLLTVHDDAQWVRAQVGALTTQQERSLDTPWAVEDAPDDYIQARLRSIVGIEITLTQLSGKYKVSQNQSAANQASLAQALQAHTSTDAQAMAELVRAHSTPKPAA